MAAKASGARRPIYGVGRDRQLAVATIAEATVKIVKAAHDSRMIKFNDRSSKPTAPELAISIDAPHHLRGDNIARIRHLARVFHSDSMAAFDLNIWTPDKKVLNAEYYGSSIGFASFRRGRWENALLYAAERSPITVAVKSRIPMTKPQTTEYPDQYCIVITEELWAILRNIMWFDPHF
jgi:hypothetical protein